MFTADRSCSSQSFSFFWGPCIQPPVRGFPEKPFLNESLYLVGVSAVIQLCGSPVGVVVMAKGTHCNPVIRSLSFCGPLSLGCDLHKYLSAFSLP